MLGKELEKREGTIREVGGVGTVWKNFERPLLNCEILQRS